LHYVGTDPKERKQIENEQEARRTIDVVLNDFQEKLAERDKALNEKDQQLVALKAQMDELKKQMGVQK